MLLFYCATKRGFPGSFGCNCIVLTVKYTNLHVDPLRHGRGREVGEGERTGAMSWVYLWYLNNEILLSHWNNVLLPGLMCCFSLIAQVFEIIHVDISVFECTKMLLNIHVKPSNVLEFDVLLIVLTLINSFPLTLWVKAACFVLAIEVLLHARVLTLICACPIFKANFSHYKFSNANLRHF